MLISSTTSGLAAERTFVKETFMGASLAVWFTNAVDIEVATGSTWTDLDNPSSQVGQGQHNGT